ncbi:MAG TPA: hypothetical protein VG870_13655 [Chitinophagaceae bacterium]|nr:hypothetical protein [Chitinophagaceae bacterium]
MRSFRRAAAFTAIGSGLVGLVCLWLGVVASGYSDDLFYDPGVILDAPRTSSLAARWSMLADLFGYYLLVLPLVFYVHGWLRSRTPSAPLLTFCGAAYVLLGVLGAAILSVIMPSLMDQYPLRGNTEQMTLRYLMRLINDLVYGGIWNLGSLLFGSAWWLGLGFHLQKKTKVLGQVTVLLGLLTALVVLTGMIGWQQLSELATNIYLVLALIWAVWMGIAILGEQVCPEGSRPVR